MGVPLRRASSSMPRHPNKNISDRSVAYSITEEVRATADATNFRRVVFREAKLSVSEPKLQTSSKVVSLNRSKGSSKVVNVQDSINNDDELNLPPKFMSYLESIHWNSAHGAGSGLVNMGNTCFLNAILQCIIYSPPMANLALSCDHSRNCRSNANCLLCELEVLIQRALSGRSRSFPPHGIIKYLRSIAPTFRLGRQEDAQEFLRLLLEKLNKCCSRGLQSRSRTQSRLLETSFVHSVYGGWTRSQVKCLSCSYDSNTYESFLDVSLELPQVSSLEAAFKHFSAPEILDGSNKYKCDRCKKLVRAQKQMLIHRSPNVLCVHLKRFAFTMYGERKVNKVINYPTSLDLEPYMTESGKSFEVQKPSPRTRARYSLFGVVIHCGSSSNSGHYYSFVRSGAGSWYCMDDESVRQVSASAVLGQRGAYMLFYIRQSPTPTFLPPERFNGNGVQLHCNGANGVSPDSNGLNGHATLPNGNGVLADKDDDECSESDFSEPTPDDMCYAKAILPPPEFHRPRVRRVTHFFKSFGLLHRLFAFGSGRKRKREDHCEGSIPPPCVRKRGNGSVAWLDSGPISPTSPAGKRTRRDRSPGPAELGDLVLNTSPLHKKEKGEDFPLHTSEKGETLDLPGPSTLPATVGRSAAASSSSAVRRSPRIAARMAPSAASMQRAPSLTLDGGASNPSPQSSRGLAPASASSLTHSPPRNQPAAPGALPYDSEDDTPSAGPATVFGTAVSSWADIDRLERLQSKKAANGTGSETRSKRQRDSWDATLDQPRRPKVKKDKVPVSLQSIRLGEAGAGNVFQAALESRKASANSMDANAEPAPTQKKRSRSRSQQSNHSVRSQSGMSSGASSRSVGSTGSRSSDGSKASKRSKWKVFGRTERS